MPITGIPMVRRLVSFSIVRKLPNTKIIPQAHYVCGTVGYAPYALPGSQALGEVIAATFGEGVDVVLLENHGIVTGGKDLLTAFHRFETLDFCARTLIRARTVGEVRSLTDEEIELSRQRGEKLRKFRPEGHSTQELVLRKKIVDIVHRAYDQRLMTSTEGTVSARVDDESFLITPFGVDRKYLDVDDVVLIRGDRRERRKRPSRAVRLHMTLYREHPEIGAIITAQSPSATAYSITGRKLDTRTIPESYIVLRDIPLIPYGEQFGDGEALSERINDAVPVLLLQNDAILTTGRDLAQAFDRLEVAEFSASALIDTEPIGAMVPIGEEALEELREKFNLAPAT